MREIKNSIDRILEAECDLGSLSHSLETESVLLRERLEHIDEDDARSKIEDYRKSMGQICDRVDAAIAKVREDLAAMGVDASETAAA